MSTHRTAYDNRTITREDLLIHVQYPWSYRLNRFKAKPSEFQVCWTAGDGYRVIASFTTRRRAQRFIDTYQA